jgi:hypothetical protein
MLRQRAEEPWGMCLDRDSETRQENFLCAPQGEVWGKGLRIIANRFVYTPRIQQWKSIDRQIINISKSSILNISIPSGDGDRRKILAIARINLQ